jgi:hypothetical protein
VAREGDYLMAQDGDQLIEKLCMGVFDSEVADTAANDLLKQIFRGYPVQNVRRLIYSENDESVKAGAWIISELGARSVQLMDEIDFLLGHRIRNARFFAVDAVLGNRSADSGAVVAKAVMLVTDPDHAVRRKVLLLLAKAARDQLEAALPYMQDHRAVDLTSWLINDAGSLSFKREVLEKLNDLDKSTRMFAAAAAMRIADRDREGIERASDSDDSDIHAVARREIGISHKYLS